MIDVNHARSEYTHYIGAHPEDKDVLEAAFLHVVMWIYKQSYQAGHADGYDHAIKEWRRGPSEETRDIRAAQGICHSEGQGRT